MNGFFKNFNFVNEVIEYDFQKNIIINNNVKLDSMEFDVSGSFFRVKNNHIVFVLTGDDLIYRDGLESWNLKYVNCFCIRIGSHQYFMIFKKMKLLYSMHVLEKDNRTIFDATHDGIDETSLYFFKYVESLNKRARKHSGEAST